MKNILLYGSLLLLLLGCQSNEQEYNVGSSFQQSIINVKVLNGTKKKKYAFVDQSGHKQFNINNNQFSFSVDHSEPQISKLIIDFYTQINFFIAPGDTLNLSFSENDIYNGFGHKFKGKNHRINNFIGKIDKTLKHQNTSFYHFFNCEPDIFIHKMDSLEMVCSSYFESFLTNQTIKPSKNIITLISSYINFKIGWYYSNYPSIYKNTFINGEVETNKLSEILASKILKKTKKSFNNISYLDYLNHHVNNTTIHIFRRSDYYKGTKNFPDLDLYFYVIDSLSTSDLEQEYLKFKVLQTSFFRRDKSFPKFSSRFIEKYPRSKYIETIKGMELDLGSIINEELISKYTFYDLDNEEKNLSEFKGKVIYIDFWATWCSPCRDQMKYLNEVANQFHDEENLKILCISLDKKENFQKWGKTIQIDGIQGEHWIADNAFKSEVCKDLQIGGIPRYVIFDKTGNLFDANAISPSNDRIIKVLNRLVNE